jgi:hypothetical protein
MTETVKNDDKMIGFGPKHIGIALYIANRPEIDGFPNGDSLQPLASGDVAYVGQHTSNHWRKIFNVSAKFLFELYSTHVPLDSIDTWQAYRETRLFQAESHEALLFSPPCFDQTGLIHIIAGKTYAQQLALPPLTWLDEHFAINMEQRIIVCPYLDYRQLSNARITTLVALVQQVQNPRFAPV